MKNEPQSILSHFGRPVEEFTSKVIVLGSVTVTLVVNLVTLF